MMTYADIAASADARAWASQAAQNTYQQSIMAGNSSAQALAQAQFDFQKKLSESQQTGMWNGQWSNPQQQWFTGQFGQWFGAGGEPGVGAYTLPAQQQAQAQSALYGQYIAPGAAPTAGQQTLGAIGQAQQNALGVAGLTGYYNAPGAAAGGQGTQTLAGQQQQWQQAFQQQQFAAQQQQLQQQNAQQYLQLLSSLRGPADWAKYQQVLGSTPGGMRDLAAAAMGQYIPGGGATTGVQPQAVNLNTMQQQIAGTPGQYEGYVGQSQYYPGVQGAPQPWDSNATRMANLNTMQQQVAGYGQPQAQGQVWGGTANMSPEQQRYTQFQQARPGGNETWGSGIGVGAQQPTPAQQQQAMGGGTNMYGAQQQQYNLPAPNQIAAQSWNNMVPSQQQMLLGQYEAQGWDKGDVQALYQQSLPKYASNAASAGTWRLK